MTKLERIVGVVLASTTAIAALASTASAVQLPAGVTAAPHASHVEQARSRGRGIGIGAGIIGGAIIGGALLNRY